MQDKVKRQFDEIIKLIEHMERETTESQQYFERGDMGSALRNVTASRDEMDLVQRKYRELISALDQLSRT